MDNFTFLDGIQVSVFSILVVFVVLYVLSLILSVFSKVLDKFEVKKPVEEVTSVIEDDDHEEKLVAQIVASCLLQKGESSNVRIKSIVRVK